VLRDHCAHARFVWNLAVEQQSWWRPGRRSAPGFLEQCRQLTQTRAGHDWLREGSQMVQQQALRDFAQAMTNFFAMTHRRPTWRKADRDEGFRIVAVKPGHVRRLSRNAGEVWIPKAGWVPGTGGALGVDRGVAVSAALSTGEMLTIPRPGPAKQRRLRRLQRKLDRARRGSNRRARVKRAIAKLRAREADARKDWAEKTSTNLARRFDVIRVEDLRVKDMTRSARGTIAEPGRRVRQKAGLNRGILASAWGRLVRRLQDKAPGRVEKIKPHYTSQRCSACGHVAAGSRESQALFCCVACGYACNADVNAARNIAAGHAVTAWGGDGVTRPVNREPQLLLHSA